MASALFLCAGCFGQLRSMSTPLFWFKICLAFVSYIHLEKLLDKLHVLNKQHLKT